MFISRDTGVQYYSRFFSFDYKSFGHHVPGIKVVFVRYTGGQKKASKIQVGQIKIRRTTPKNLLLNICNRKICSYKSTRNHPSATMLVEPTFQTKGIRSKKAVFSHLFENAYDSNLLPDITDVDYLAGKPWLDKSLHGLTPFVDNIFGFGYLRGTQVWFRNAAEISTRPAR